MEIDIPLIIYAIGSVLLSVCSLVNWILIYRINAESKKNDNEEQKILKRIDELDEKYKKLEFKCDFTKKLFDTATLTYNIKLCRKDDD